MALLELGKFGKTSAKDCCLVSFQYQTFLEWAQHWTSYQVKQEHDYIMALKVKQDPDSP